MPTLGVTGGSMTDSGSTGGGAGRQRLVTLVLIALFAAVIGAGAIRFRDVGGVQVTRGLGDFDAFYLASKLVLEGRIADAYRYADFAAVQRAVSSTKALLLWSYPPPFDLVVAPLALLPRGWAFTVFVAATFASYLVALRRLAGAEPAVPLVLLGVPFAMGLFCGQNGFLTGTLVALACIGLTGGKRWAGVPLGLMVIKPHLALGVGLYTLCDRRWAVVGMAVLTAAGSALLATAAFGTDIWAAFLISAAETGEFLERGLFPLHRMVSVYASARTVRLAPTTALAVHAVAALAVIAATVLAHRRLAAREALGIAVMASMLISPYAYDYDLPVLGVAVALLWPALRERGRAAERLAFAVALVVAGGFGTVQAYRIDDPIGTRPLMLTLAGPLLLLAFALVWRVLARGAQATQVSSKVRAMASGGGASQSPEPASAA